MAHPSLALVNGRLRTGDPRRPVADALAIEGAHLVLVGSSAEVRKLVAHGTRVVDLRGAAVHPVAPVTMLRRGEVANVAVVTDDGELLRVMHGVVVVDALP